MPEANIFENDLVDSFNKKINKIKMKYIELNSSILEDYQKNKEKSKNTYDSIKKDFDADFKEKIKYLENMKKMADEVVPVTIQTYESLKNKIINKFDEDIKLLENESSNKLESNFESINLKRESDLKKYQEIFDKEIKSIDIEVKDLKISKGKLNDSILNNSNNTINTINKNAMEEKEKISTNYDLIKKEVELNIQKELDSIENDYQKNVNRFMGYQNDLIETNREKQEEELKILKEEVVNRMNLKNKSKLDEFDKVEQKIENDFVLLNKKLNEQILEFQDSILKDKIILEERMKQKIKIKDNIKVIEKDLEQIKNGNRIKEYNNKLIEIEELREEKELELNEKSTKEVDEFIFTSINNIFQEKESKLKSYKSELKELDALIKIYNDKIFSKINIVDLEIINFEKNIINLEIEKDELKKIGDSISKNGKSNKFKENEILQLRNQYSDENNLIIKNINEEFNKKLEELNENKKISELELENNLLKLNESIKKCNENMSKVNNDISKLDLEFANEIEKLKIENQKEMKDDKEKFNENKQSELEDAKKIIHKSIENIMKDRKLKLDNKKINLKSKLETNLGNVELLTNVNTNEVNKIKSNISTLEVEIDDIQSIITQNSLRISDYTENFNKFIATDRENNSKNYKLEKYIIEKENEKKLKEEKEQLIEFQNKINNLEKSKADLVLLLTNGQINDQGKTFVIIEINEIDKQIEDINNQKKIFNSRKSLDLGLIEQLNQLNSKYINIDNDLEDNLNGKINELEKINSNLKSNINSHNQKIIEFNKLVNNLNVQNNEMKNAMKEGIYNEYNNEINKLDKEYNDIFNEKLNIELEKTEKILGQKFDTKFNNLSNKNLDEKINNYQKIFDSRINKVYQEKQKFMDIMNQNIIDLGKTENDKKIMENEFIKSNNKLIKNLNEDLIQVEANYKSKINDIENKINKKYSKEGLEELIKSKEIEILSNLNNKNKFLKEKEKLNKEIEESSLLVSQNKVQNSISELELEFVKQVENLELSKDKFIENKITVESEKLFNFIKENKSKLKEEYKTSLKMIETEESNLVSKNNEETDIEKEIISINGNILKKSENIEKLNSQIKINIKTKQKNEKNLKNERDTLNFEIGNQIEEAFKIERKDLDKKYKKEIDEIEFDKVIEQFMVSKDIKVKDNKNKLESELKQIENTRLLELEKLKKKKDNELININKKKEQDIIDLNNQFDLKIENLINTKLDKINNFQEFNSNINSDADNKIKDFKMEITSSFDEKIKNVTNEKDSEIEKINQSFKENMDKYNVDFQTKIYEEKDLYSERIKKHEINFESEIKESEIRLNSKKKNYFKNFNKEIKEEEEKFKNQCLITI